METVAIQQKLIAKMAQFLEQKACRGCHILGCNNCDIYAVLFHPLTLQAQETEKGDSYER